MKKLFLFSTLIFFLSACSSDDEAVAICLECTKEYYKYYKSSTFEGYGRYELEPNCGPATGRVYTTSDKQFNDYNIVVCPRK